MREAARIRMVMEATNGRGRGRRQHHGGNGTCCGVTAARLAMVEAAAAATAMKAARRGWWDRRSLLQREGRRDVSEYVSIHAHASTNPLTPLTRLTLPYLWVRAGIRAIPARVYYLGVLMRLSIRSEAAAEMARRNGGKGWGGARTRPRAGRRAACCRGHIVGQRGGDPREDPGHAGEAGMLDGQGYFGVQYRRSIPSSSHASMPSTVRPAHRATLRSATAASPVRRRSHTDCRLIAPG